MAYLMLIGLGAEFLRRVADARPGCVLLNMGMPEMGGLEVQAALNARGVEMPVIMLTGQCDVGTTVAAMRGGARDVIEKPLEIDRLLKGIASAFESRDKGMEAAQKERSARALIALLSPREQEVLHGLVLGKPNKVIAHDLSISPRTIEVYRANLMGKLDVRSLSEALQLAFAAGLLESHQAGRAENSDEIDAGAAHATVA